MLGQHFQGPLHSTPTYILELAGPDAHFSSPSSPGPDAGTEVLRVVQPRGWKHGFWGPKDLGQHHSLLWDQAPVSSPTEWGYSWCLPPRDVVLD